MKTTKLLVPLLTLACTLMLSSCKTADSPATSAPSNVLYVCGCGADCKCNVASTKPGKCGCGHALKPGHLCKVEGDTALLCMCDVGCKCAVDAKEPAKCGCGKPLHKVSLKGTGIYFCNCGGSCTCNTVSDKPSQCKCGMALKKVD
ncbi:MAG: hypothetical protein HZA90_24630 [Verrucomicrobia bacterium]|nr:hypothetical protein [Verrucomicrobiota bacterium]